MENSLVWSLLIRSHSLTFIHPSNDTIYSETINWMVCSCMRRCAFIINAKVNVKIIDMNMIFYFWLKEKPYIEFVSHSATCARDFGTKNFVENSTNAAIGPANRIRIIIYGNFRRKRKRINDSNEGNSQISIINFQLRIWCWPFCRTKQLFRSKAKLKRID